MGFPKLLLNLTSSSGGISKGQTIQTMIIESLDFIFCSTSRGWYADTTTENLQTRAHQNPHLLDLWERQKEKTWQNREDRCTQVVRRYFKETNGSRKPFCCTVIQNTGIPAAYEKNTRSTLTVRAELQSVSLLYLSYVAANWNIVSIKVVNTSWLNRVSVHSRQASFTARTVSAVW